MYKLLWKRLRPHKPTEFGFKDYRWDEFKGTDDEKEFLKRWRVQYPVNYFYNKYVRGQWAKNKHRMDEVVYFCKCHLLPSYKFHLIDIRQPKGSGIDDYRWGFTDTDARLVLACFSLLVNFVHKELEIKKEEDWEGHFFKENNIKENACRQTILDHNKYIEEVRQLYRYWTWERKEEWKYCERTLMEWYKVRNKASKKKEEKLFKISQDAKEAFVQREEDMLIRLIRIRKFLWT